MERQRWGKTMTGLRRRCTCYTLGVRHQEPWCLNMFKRRVEVGSRSGRGSFGMARASLLGTLGQVFSGWIMFWVKNHARTPLVDCCGLKTLARTRPSHWSVRLGFYRTGRVGLVRWPMIKSNGAKVSTMIYVILPRECHIINHKNTCVYANSSSWSMISRQFTLVSWAAVSRVQNRDFDHQKM